VSADSILQGQAKLSGQDMTVLPKLLDRVCVFATADNVASLRSVIAADSSFDAATRFVPFLAKAPSRAATSSPAERLHSKEKSPGVTFRSRRSFLYHGKAPFAPDGKRGFISRQSLL